MLPRNLRPNRTAPRFAYRLLKLDDGESDPDRIRRAAREKIQVLMGENSHRRRVFPDASVVQERTAVLLATYHLLDPRRRRRPRQRVQLSPRLIDYDGESDRGWWTSPPLVDFEYTSAIVGSSSLPADDRSDPSLDDLREIAAILRK